MAPPWRCNQCAIANRATAEYCPSCGQHWTKVVDRQRTDPPWTSYSNWQAEARPKSPRRPSPRRRGAKGKAGKDGKGNEAPAKGSRPTGSEAPTAPATAQLPKPPKAKVTALPKEPAASSAPVTEERRVLDALLGHLAAQDSLPESVRSLVVQATQTTAKTEAKALHKLVAQRQEALSSLERIKHERAAYEQGWATYTQSLLDILAQQFTDRTENLRKMDEAQSQWAAKLAETAKALKQATKDKSETIEVHSGEGSEDEDDMEAMDAEVDQAAQEAAQAELRQQRQAAAGQKIMQALTTVRDEAAAGAVQRERTPRRRGKEPTAEANDKDKDGGSTGKDGSGKTSQPF